MTQIWNRYDTEMKEVWHMEIYIDKKQVWHKYIIYRYDTDGPVPTLTHKYMKWLKIIDLTTTVNGQNV